jgi:hypothetical protein
MIEFAAAPDYAPIVFSLKYQGVEWLASSFPEPCACSWWNPWLGGLGYALEDEMSTLSLLEEKSSVNFAELLRTTRATIGRALKLRPLLKSTKSTGGWSGASTH